MRSIPWHVRPHQAIAFLALCGCPSPPISPQGPDASPPGLVQVTVRLEAPGAPNPQAEFDITNRTIVRTGIGSDRTLRVIATVGDPQSGISNITIESNLTWRCQISPTSPIVGIFQSVPLTFDPITQPASPVTPIQINVASTPVLQTGCARPVGGGPIGIRGHVRVAVTNGAGAVTKSQTFIFEYLNALGPPTGTSTTTGRMDQGTETLYIAECRSRSVPIPPGWSRNTTAWIPHGNLAVDNSNLLDPGNSAFVWSYTDPAVRGACIALPRSGGGSGSGRAGLAGIICQSATTGAACFWDSRNRDDANPMSLQPMIDWANQPLDINQLKDATNLTEPDGGVCTDCHRGSNVFLMAPDAAAWGSVMRTHPGLDATFTTLLEASSDNQGGRPRYVPVTGLGGQNRPGWANSFSNATCGASCHEIFNPGALYTQPAMPPSCAGGAQNSAACYR